MNTLKKQMLAAAMSAIVFATTVFGTPQEGVREYEWEYPDEGEQEFLQDSDQWRGTAWLEDIEMNEDWQGTNLDHFGNEHSTVRLTDCEFSLYYDNEPTPVKVAVELVDDEDIGKPALFARDLRQGTYNFEKIKGDGTLRARTTDPWSSSAIVIKNYDQFAGSIETECAVVFGEDEDPERSSIGRIVIPEDATVTIAEGKHFSTQELKIDGTLVVNGALLNIEMVSGSGTVVLPAEIEDGTNIGTYGCEESTIRFSNDFTGTFSNGCRIRGNLDLGGNTIKLTGGDNTEPYVINRLVGTGILNIEEASQPIEIREVLDAYTWTIAYEGRIIGDTGKVTLPEGFKIDSHGYICRESETRYYVTLPSETTGGSYVVSNLTAECTIEPTEAGGSTYALPDGAKVGIYMVPKKGYVVTGDPYIINEIKSDKTIDAADLPKAKAPEVEYYAWDEAKKAVDGPFTTNAIPVTADMTTLESGWYVVQGSVENTTGGIVVNGDVHLILAEGAEFVVIGQVENGMGAAGVCVVGENKLNVYGETAECTGKLIAQGGYGAAGIGGFYDNGKSACGAIDIHGGIVMVTGGAAAAGIGGGAMGDGGVISVYGGSVTATSGVDDDLMTGAGIGGGAMGAGGEFNLWGGTVHAETSLTGAGVGGGVMGNGAAVTIHGGHLTAIGGVLDGDGKEQTSPGLGCGYVGSDPGTFTVADDCTCQVLAGRDEGSLTEVDANDFAQEQEDPEDPEETIYVGWYTNVFVQITATMAPVAQPEGSQGNPWKVGVEGAEESVLAWTNGTGTVFAKGTGTPKTFGDGEDPWAGAPITEIIVPRGRGDDFKAAWTSLADLIKEVPDYLSFTSSWPTSNPEDFVIEDGVLTYYKGLDAEVAIPEGVTAIVERAFFDMKWVERVYVPKSVKNIAPLAFAMCGALEDVLFEQGTELESIEASAFAGAGITSIAVPDSVKTVGRGAFNGCTALTEVWLGNGLETIAEDAFYDPLFGMPEEGLPIEVIYVPTGKGDAYKEMLCEALKDLVVETDESVPVFEFGSALMCTSNADEPLPLEWTDDPVGGTWADVEYGVELPLVAGKTIFLRKKGGDVALSANGLQINLSGDAFVEAHGNVMSLLDQSCQSVTVGERAFYGLFSDCAVLTTAPKLPATNLADRCYRGMFANCTALANAPTLPATSLTNECYYVMFSGCTSLTNAPALPAPVLATKCYVKMFSGCTSLTNAPVLPAMTLATNCYDGMFENCTALADAPELTAMVLTNDCYKGMFSGCTSLTNAPALPATKLARRCYISMFSKCTSLTNAPVLSAAKLEDECYLAMFSGCSLINYVSVGFKDWNSGDESTKNWLRDVSETGVFTCPIELPVITDASHIPEGWVVKKRFTLPAALPTCSYVVSNETSGAVLVEPVGSEPGSEEYEVTVGDTIKIYMQPAEGYVVGGENPLTLNLTEGINLKEVMPWAVRPIPYQAWDEANKVMTNAVCTEKYEYVTPGTRELRSGWYVVQGNVNNPDVTILNPGVTILGDVHLILCDDAEWAVNGSKGGFVVSAGRSLTIYGQADGTGKLFAQGGGYSAGIGGGEKSSGTITINGGQVTAQGGFFAAGIGGGANSGTGGTVTINGGMVLAISNDVEEDVIGGGGAGIGGGAMSAGGAVTINGGEVTAISYPVNDDGALYYAEGIGAGAMGGDSGTLDLSGYTGKYYIYAGMDVTGVEAEEVQAGDFATWHTNLYVQITQTKRQDPALADYEFNEATGTIIKYKGAGGDVEIPAQIGGVAVRVIGEEAFGDCSSLTTLTIPASVTNIEFGAVNGCAQLTRVMFAEGSQLESIGKAAFQMCDALAEIEIPARVKTIGDNAFTACWNLTNLTFEAGSQLEIIGECAFRNCNSLTEVVIPASVTNLDQGAFMASDSLTKVMVAATEPPTAAIEVFADCEALEKIYVPYGTKAAYVATEGWAPYADKIVEIPNYLAFTARNGAVTIGMSKMGTIDAPLLETAMSPMGPWTTFAAGETTIPLAADQTVYFRRSVSEATTLLNGLGSADNYWFFSMTPQVAGATVAASGNVMSLLDQTCASDTVGELAFCGLFDSCTALTDAPELPAMNLAAHCYYSMFSFCSSLTNAPALPAMTLKDSCYHSMFGFCSSLTTAPKLPATKLATSCYMNLFYHSTSLNSISVEFKDWDNDVHPTTFWVDSVAAEGVFTCPIELPVKTGDTYIPEEWVVKKRFTLPAALPTCSYVVTNAAGEVVEPIGTTAGGRIYEVPVNGDEDAISIYVKPKEGYVPVGANPLVVNLSKGGEIGTLPKAALPAAPATVKIVSAKSARTEGAWSGAAEVVYELSNLKADGRYALAFELTAAGQFGARTNEVEAVVDGVYTQELFCAEFFGIESQVQDPAAKLELKLIEKSKAAK